jgi:competence CoiA-like predicted nuclease
MDSLSRRSLSVVCPEIASVLDSATGIERPVSEVLGNDYERLMQLRLEVKSAIHEGMPRYLCSECFTPVYICRRRDTRRFFFRHSKEDGRCSAVTRGELSQEQIAARKYNGAKESLLHLQMKRWLVDSLVASGRFTEIHEEKRWSGPITGEWRKPDVLANLDGLKIAFEVQLSTTFLDVIAERRLFYLKEGGLLFWIFARFDEDARRLTLDDVFYNNNQNAFIVSHATREASVEAGDFLLDCVWAEPASQLGQLVKPSLSRGRVSFGRVTLDQARQQAYYFDYRGVRSKRDADDLAERASWPQQFEAWFLEVAGRYSSLHEQEEVLAAFPEGVPTHWATQQLLTHTPLRFYGNAFRLPVSMLDAFYSAKHHRVVGINRKLFIEVAHYVAAQYPHYLLWFRRALEVYGCASLLKAQDRSGSWTKRVKAYRSEMDSDPEKYAADQKHQLLFEFLFPELLPLPLWPGDTGPGLTAT